MGFADRDYNRSGPYGPRGGGTGGGAGLWSQMRLWSVTTWIIAINVAVFVVDMMTGRLLANWGYFSVEAVFYFGQVWRVITFQFLHHDLNHIFFNMLALYFFGGMVENYLGPRRYLAFYLLSGVAGAGMYVVLWALHVLITDPGVPLIGASAGIFGVLLAAVQIAPDARVMLMFPPIPMRLKTLAWVMIAIAAYTVLGHGFNAGGEAAHLGGAAVGAGLIRKPSLLNVFEFRRRRKHWDPFRPDFRR